jgi:hypothetical protein
LMEVVVLPTPPLPLAIARIFTLDHIEFGHILSPF